MTNDRTSRTRADAPNSELTEAQLDLVSGGVVAPRDAATGLATGKRMHRLIVSLAV